MENDDVNSFFSGIRTKTINKNQNNVRKKVYNILILRRVSRLVDEVIHVPSHHPRCFASRVI